ncbi:MAG: nickel pincer cofactor biosynthesis protein LarB [Candidatus Thorarchaeota archaeon]|jgi:NCAIR mutase (PurE)-related protein
MMRNTRDILEALSSGKISIDDAEKELRALALAQVGNIGMIDVSRQERCGVPEVVFAETKSLENLIRIVEVVVDKIGAVLLTRVSRAKVDGLKKVHTSLIFDVSGHEDHLTVLAHNDDWSDPPKSGKIAIITAGTSDIAFSREAEALARIMGVEVLTFHDIGVAGIHRLIEPIKTIVEEKVDSLIVFAGMEGALPTVIAALVDIPVIGVPVPTGYGYGGKGETALASMLQSCAPGLAVVNIGNGLGAGAVACLIAKRCANKAGE